MTTLRKNVQDSFRLIDLVLYLMVDRPGVLIMLTDLFWSLWVIYMTPFLDSLLSYGIYKDVIYLHSFAKFWNWGSNLSLKCHQVKDIAAVSFCFNEANHNTSSLCRLNIISYSLLLEWFLLYQHYQVLIIPSQ